MKFHTAALFVLVTTAASSAAFTPANGLFGVSRRSEATRKTSIKRTNDALFSTTKKSPAETAVETAASAPDSTFAPSSGQSAVEARSAAASYLAQYKGQSGAAAVYSKLQENGVLVVNGYSGGAVLPLLDQFHEEHPRHATSGKKPIRWITNSNEQNAGHVTEGIAKAMPIDGDDLPVGVCVATSGPGVTNLITPLQDAICDGVPMVVLCGQAASTAPEDAFQSSPAVELTTPCTKWSYSVKSAAEIPFALDYAFYIARNGRPGPVFVDFPKDLQNQIIDDDLINSFVEGSLNENSKDSFARLMDKRRADGSNFKALHFGLAEKGLSFEVAKEATGALKLSHVSTVGGNDMYGADHCPQNKVYHFNEGVNGSNEFTEGDMDGGIMKNIVKLLKTAKKPIIIAGQGCNSCPDELKKLAETLQIPVTTTLHALGCFDERAELALNMMGMHGHPTPNFMVQQADLIINIGSRFDDRITGKIGDFIPEARKAAEEGRGGVIHVDIRLSEKAKQVTPNFFVHSTAKTFLEKVNSKLEEQDVSTTSTKDWLAQMKGLKVEYPIGIPRFPKRTIPNESGEGISRVITPMAAQGVVQEMNLQLLKAGEMDNCIFTTGVGIHQMVAAQLITWTQPRQMLSSGSLGTMGVSTGFVIGAKLAQPGKTCISVDGDGSFNMTFTELKTIMEQGIPVKILILDNEAQMMVEYWQRLFHDKRYLAVRNTNPDYVKLAGAFGIKAVFCDSEEDLPAKMEQFLFEDPDQPVLFHVKIERTPCLPLVAPGQRLENMILEDEDFEVDPAAAPS